MSFISWLRRSIGRTYTGTKAHLIETARLLDFSDDTVERMTKVGDEECEAIFLEKIAETHGGAADWRAEPTEVLEVIEPLLTTEERGLLATIQFEEEQRPGETVKKLDAHLATTGRAVRALDSFGDFIIVVLVPRERLAAFDAANEYWSA